MNILLVHLKESFDKKVWLTLGIVLDLLNLPLAVGVNPVFDDFSQRLKAILAAT